MPISVDRKLVPMTQKEFGEIAYQVVEHSFAIHSEMGSLFDETVYRNALANRLDNASTEVRMTVSFESYQKDYLMDLVVADGGVFELKTVKKLNPTHRNQLLNYLLLTELNHGKLINFGRDKVHHEFVNAKVSRQERLQFDVVETDWVETDGFDHDFKALILAMIEDWGTSLDLNLYKGGIYHFLGGKDHVCTKQDVFQDGMPIGKQVIPMCGPTTGLCITTLSGGRDQYVNQLVRLLGVTNLSEIQWINISRNRVVFETVRKGRNPR